MKKIKNIVAASLASVLMCTNVANVSAASIPNAAIEQVGLDNIDVLLASHYYLASAQDDMNFWPDNFSSVEIVPLYDTEGEISSYYVELADGVGYAVINNNVENPCAIEFGAGNNPQIREILDNTADPHIIYNSPVSLYNLSEIGTISLEEDMADIYTNYPDLREPSDNLANTISQQKLLLENAVMPCDSYEDYGFLDGNKLPATDSYKRNWCAGYSSVDWLAMSEVSSDKVKNHCGATAVTNLMLYFAKQGYTSLLKSAVDSTGQYRIDTFKSVHEIVGNGAAVTIAGDAVDYCSHCGITLNYKTNRNIDWDKRIDAYETAVGNDRPCGILLEDVLNSWHWVIGVGYRDYRSSSNGVYFEIITGWDRGKDAVKWYKAGEESTWISSTEYWVE